MILWELATKSKKDWGAIAPSAPMVPTPMPHDIAYLREGKDSIEMLPRKNSIIVRFYTDSFCAGDTI